MFFVRLSRILPLLVILAVLAGVIYMIMSFRYSSNRAKYTLIKLFTWLCTGLSVFFLIITLYALFEKNVPVTELNASFLATTLVGLGITRICAAVFKKNHPGYAGKFKVVQATMVNENESVGEKFAGAFKRALFDALRETFGGGSNNGPKSGSK